MSGLPTDRLAEVWGVVRATARDNRLRELDAVLGGLVLIDGPPMGPGRENGAADDQSLTSRALARAILTLPAHAAAVAWLDDTPPAVDVLAALIARLPGHDAVTMAVHYSDAVKRVRDGLIVGGVDRNGLCRPVPPLVVRADIARGRLVPALDAGRSPIAAVAAAGCIVAITTWAELEVW